MDLYSLHLSFSFSFSLSLSLKGLDFRSGSIHHKLLFPMIWTPSLRWPRSDRIISGNWKASSVKLNWRTSTANTYKAVA
ncbi:hypothetical protein HanIR_Chr07g0305291 [Helianthus annuus]|nr:hypothetical protein HanIR_Chr07g0305291 [Helianthus annuus]